MVVGPVKRTKYARTVITPFSDDPEANGHYIACRYSNSQKKLTCFEAIDDMSGSVVGFLSIEKSTEDHGNSTALFFSIDFVYLLPAFRQTGLAKELCKKAAIFGIDWMREFESHPLPINLYSTSNGVSRNGVKFVYMLEMLLQGFCKHQKISFISSTDPERNYSPP